MPKPPELSAEDLRRIQIRNIKAKMSSGKVLTAREMSLLQDAPAEEDWLPNRDKLGKALGLHPNSIARIRREYKDDPELAEICRPNGSYFLPGWRRFIEKHGIRPGSIGTRNSEPETRNGVLSRRDQMDEEKIRRLRFENSVREGAYVTRDFHLQFFREYTEEMKGRCRAIEDELPPLLAGLNPGAVRLQLKSWNDRLCAAMQEWSKKLNPESTPP